MHDRRKMPKGSPQEEMSAAKKELEIVSCDLTLLMSASTVHSILTHVQFIYRTVYRKFHLFIKSVDTVAICYIWSDYMYSFFFWSVCSLLEMQFFFKHFLKRHRSLYFEENVKFPQNALYITSSLIVIIRCLIIVMSCFLMLYRYLAPFQNISLSVLIKLNP